MYVWKNHVPQLCLLPPLLCVKQIPSRLLATWNCRGLHNSNPYIKHPISKGTDILVLHEHWLWPFELDQLESIDPNYTHTAVCDNHLSPTSTLRRGCGGCAILWKKTIPATLVSNLESNRICGIQLPLEGTHSALTILGAYMPSSDQPQEVYNAHLATINQAITQIPPSSPLLIVGVLNCHLGSRGGPRSSADPNQRGLQWKDLINSHSLYVPSLSNLASGPVHTFFSRTTTTTVDYIIGNLTTSTAIVSCIVLSTHLIISLLYISNLNLSLLTLAPRSSDQNNSLDWNSALRLGSIPQYASLMDEAVAPLLDKDYCSVEEIEADISHVSNVLIEASIPHFRCSNSNSNHVYDPHLSSLC